MALMPRFGYEAFDGVGHHPPDDELLPLLEQDVRKGDIARLQLDPALSLEQFLDGAFPINDGNHNTSMLGFEGAVDDQDVPIEDAKFNHGVATRHGQKGGCRMRDELGCQVNPFGPQVFRR